MSAVPLKSSYPLQPLWTVVSLNDSVLPESTPGDCELQYADISSVSYENGIETVEALRFSDAPSRARRVVRNGDVIVSTVRTYLKAIAEIRNPPENLVVSTGFAVLRPKPGLSPRFLAYLAKSDEFCAEVESRSVGVSYPAIGPHEISRINVPVPPERIQNRIADFLDRETAEIDDLIEKQERLIALLEEKRQAFISHAVTKGLDPTVPMKDSGIPWIGMIPAHWQQARLKRHWKVLDCKHITAEFQDEGYPLASIGEVQSWRVNLSNAKRTSGVFFVQLTEGGRKPRPNDIILSRNATVGQTALVDADHPEFALGQDVCLIRGLRPSVEGSHFLMFLFRSSVIQQQLEELMIGATIRRINVEAVRNLSITIPPLLELPKIVEALNAASEQQANLVNTANRAKDVLLERRAALISAAVTGKIDVTGRV